MATLLYFKKILKISPVLHSELKSIVESTSRAYCIIPTTNQLPTKSDRVKKDYDAGDEEEFDRNKPYVFSKSAAYDWKAEFSRRGTNAERMPWYQTYVVMFSTMIFLLYFGHFREENDIDEQLSMPLGERLLRMEETEYLNEKAKLRHAGKSTYEMDQRLADVEKKKKKYGLSW